MNFICDYLPLSMKLSTAGNYWKLFYCIQIKLKFKKAIYYATNMCKHTGNVQKNNLPKKKIQLHSWQYEEYKVNLYQNLYLYPY